MVDVEAPDFTLGVVGAGAMGSGIAQVALTGGMRVILFDAAAAALAKSRDTLFARLDRLVEKGTATGEAMAAAKSRLALAERLQDLAGCDAVIEAVVEDLEVKRRLFRDLEEIVRPEAILASNTSSLPIAGIAKVLKHRHRVAGMHFFNPVPLMKLVEIVAAAETESVVVDALARLGTRMGRTPVRVKDAPGFLVNLGGRAFATEALHIAQEGVAGYADIDAVMRDGCGFRMGPFELMDLTGMDVNYPVSRIIWEGYFCDPRLATTPLHASLLAAGRLGRKTGIGFFRYDERNRPIPAPEPEVAGTPPARVVLAETDERLVALAVATGVETVAHDDGASPILVAPVGEDCTTACIRLGLDARRTVAIDVMHDLSRRVTLMTAPGADPAILDDMAALFRRAGRAVTRIKDSPGFIAQRILAMVANLGCEMAQMGLASPSDIDIAMRLGLNYPLGPLELADRLGVRAVYDVLLRIQEIIGSDRYRPSLWLRRRALLGLPATE